MTARGTSSRAAPGGPFGGPRGSSAPSTATQRAAWLDALDLWGVDLHDPVFVADAGESTFAWFRFPSEVTVDLALVERVGAEQHLSSILAHEIGHHVVAPSTRLDGFKVVQQMARALSALDEWSGEFRRRPSDPGEAHELANLWEDLLINTRVERLQRRRAVGAGRADDEPDLIALWRLLNGPGGDASPLWWVYCRTYELLWSLPPGTFCDVSPPDVLDVLERGHLAAGAAAAARRAAVPGPSPEQAGRVEQAESTEQAEPSADELAQAAADDAVIARAELVRLSTPRPGTDAEFLADVVRRFADDPVSGALPAGMVLARYAVLRPRQHDQAPGAGQTTRPSPGTGCGGPSSDDVPTAAELEAVLGDPRLRVVPEHPGVAAGRRAAEKAAAAGGDGADPTDGAGDEGDEVEATATPRDRAEGQTYGLAETLRLWRSTDADGVVAAWYLAEARRWVRPLTQPALLGSDPDDTIPGALEPWQLGDDVDDLDWVATLSRSPVVVPGVTTRRRDTLADAPPPRREGIELDLWVDSSGSMPGPRRGSAALVAGTILVLSVLRGGGRVRVTSFSGPGQVAGGARPTRDRVEALRDLTTSFGGGTTFPLDLLASRYRGSRLDPAVRRHLVVLSDDGLASMFGEGQPEFSGVAARVRRVLDTATLVVLGASPGMTEQAEAAGYDVRVLPGVEEAPGLCAELAAVLADPPRRPEETRGC